MKVFLKLIAKYFKEKIVYLLTNIIILFIGYSLIREGIIEADKNIASIYISIGASLIATAIVLFLDLWREVAKDNILKKVNSIIIKAGIHDVYPGRKLEKYDNLIANCKEEILISGYSLNGFFESYNSIIKSKLDSGQDLKIKVLIVNPNSNFSKERERQEGYKEGEMFKGHVARLIESFKDYDNIEIKLLDSPLTTMIYKIDNVLFIGPHFHKTSSASTLTYELTDTGWLYKSYINEFNRMWDEANIWNDPVRKIISVNSKLTMMKRKKNHSDDGVTWKED